METNKYLNPSSIRMESKYIDIKTSFNMIEFPDRCNWNCVKQSKFIESIMIQMPLHSFYADATVINKGLPLIDGKERYNAIINFIVYNKLNLTGLEFFKNFNGCKYNQLPRNIQRRIEDTNLLIHFVEWGTSLECKESIIRRLT